jgi:hypothetical protein
MPRSSHPPRHNYSNNPWRRVQIIYIVNYLVIIATDFSTLDFEWNVSALSVLEECSGQCRRVHSTILRSRVLSRLFIHLICPRPLYTKYVCTKAGLVICSLYVLIMMGLWTAYRTIQQHLPEVLSFLVPKLTERNFRLFKIHSCLKTLGLKISMLVVYFPRTYNTYLIPWLVGNSGFRKHESIIWHLLFILT